jgi:hypothetical protein
MKRNKTHYPPVTVRRTKAALIREPGYPVGVPAPMYLNCSCGHKVNVFQTSNTTCPKCGTTYDSRGWIV